MPKLVQHPGILFKTFLDDYNLTPAKLAADIKLSQSSIRLLINEKLKVSTPIALRLAKYFGNPVEFWIDLQNKYDLAEASKDAELSEILKGIPKAKKAPQTKSAQAAAPAKKGRKPAADKAVKKTVRKPRAGKKV
jgi:addiction module HigA family antidote